MFIPFSRRDNRKSAAKLHRDSGWNIQKNGIRAYARNVYARIFYFQKIEKNLEFTKNSQETDGKTVKIKFRISEENRSYAGSYERIG